MSLAQEPIRGTIPEENAEEKNRGKVNREHQTRD